MAIGHAFICCNLISIPINGNIFGNVEQYTCFLIFQQYDGSAFFQFCIIQSVCQRSIPFSIYIRCHIAIFRIRHPFCFQCQTAANRCCKIKLCITIEPAYKSIAFFCGSCGFAYGTASAYSLAIYCGFPIHESYSIFRNRTASAATAYIIVNNCRRFYTRRYFCLINGYISVICNAICICFQFRNSTITGNFHFAVCFYQIHNNIFGNIQFRAFSIFSNLDGIYIFFYFYRSFLFYDHFINRYINDNVTFFSNFFCDANSINAAFKVICCQFTYCAYLHFFHICFTGERNFYACFFNNDTTFYSHIIQNNFVIFCAADHQVTLNFHIPQRCFFYCAVNDYITCYNLIFQNSFFFCQHNFCCCYCFIILCQYTIQR